MHHDGGDDDDGLPRRRMSATAHTLDIANLQRFGLPPPSSSSASSSGMSNNDDCCSSASTTTTTAAQQQQQQQQPPFVMPTILPSPSPCGASTPTPVTSEAGYSPIPSIGQCSPTMMRSGLSSCSNNNNNNNGAAAGTGWSQATDSPRRESFDGSAEILPELEEGCARPAPLNKMPSFNRDWDQGSLRIPDAVASNPRFSVLQQRSFNNDYDAGVSAAAAAAAASVSAGSASGGGDEWVVVDQDEKASENDSDGGSEEEEHHQQQQQQRKQRQQESVFDEELRNMRHQFATTQWQLKLGFLKFGDVMDNAIERIGGVLSPRGIGSPKLFVM